MAGNSFGKNFRITSFGESHGVALGVIIDGCPAGISLDEAVIQKELDRRRPGAHASTSAGEATASGERLNPAVTSRKEADTCEILSGVFRGKTTGTPIAIVVRNTSQKSEDYNEIAQKFRPGHADYPFLTKYGIRDYRGGGRSSGRETIARVAAGAIAKAILAERGIQVLAWTSEAVGIQCTTFDTSEIECNALRAPDAEAAALMQQRIIELKKSGDSGGGIISGTVRGAIPVGLGEPVFDKLDALLAHAMFSIGAVKGFEIGSGFKAANMKGSEHNDAMRSMSTSDSDAGASGAGASLADGTPPLARFETNHAGGILGGLSNGDAINFRVAIKPVSSIAIPQKTIDTQGKDTDIEVHGRHDVCLCPRIVPVVEAMTALVLVDLLLEGKE